MDNLRFIFDIARRVVWVVGLPYAVFWSLHTFIPSIIITYNETTFAAFWVLFCAVRWMVQNIRHGDWTDLFSIE